MADSSERAQRAAAAARVLVFAPAPLLTITIEARGDQPDVHLHAGGQGFWLARMVAALGVRARLCGSFGGETGAVIRTLVEREGIDVCAVDVDTANVAYVHDRRTGRRQPVVEVPAAPLSRHDLDQLYGAMLVEGLEAQVCLLGGPPRGNVLPAGTYQRLSSDLRANGKTVIADLAGDPLVAVIAGGVDVLKVSDEELVADGRAASTAETEVLKALGSLREAGVGTVVISRADRPALAAWNGDVVEIVAPQVTPYDPHGAGDSMTAGIAAGLARGDDLPTALRLGAAAAWLNVARSGLATGRRQDIEAMTGHIELRARGAAPAPSTDAAPPTITTVDELARRTRLS